MLFCGDSEASLSEPRDGNGSGLSLLVGGGLADLMAKLLVTGAGGVLADLVTRIASEKGRSVVALSKEDCDITSARDVMLAVAHHRPDVILNCAAKTDVAACERHQEAAITVNAVGAGNVAAAAKGIGAHLVHISTDYVFSGKRQAKDTDVPYPISAYGYSKHLGEVAVRSIDPTASIVRIGWLYGVEYPRSAPMLAACGERDKSPAAIFSDIKGTPSLVSNVARVLVSRIYRPMPSGPLHLAPDEESVSWFGFLKPRFPSIKPTQSSKFHPNVSRPSEGGLVASSFFHSGLMSYALQRYRFYLDFTKLADEAAETMKKEGIQSYFSYFLQVSR